MSVQFDVFGDILNMIRLRGTVYFRLDLGAGWAVEIQPSSQKMFYIVDQGDCWLSGDFPNAPIYLQTGDMLTLPHGDYHVLSGTPDYTRLYSQFDVLAQHHTRLLTEETQACATICWGHIEFQKNILHPFLKHLPPVIHIRSVGHNDLDWLQSITRKIIQESQTPLPGSDVVVDRLAEILHLYMLRAFILDESLADHTSYWKVFSDKPIYEALQYIHQSPSTDWTLHSLAHQVGISRTLLAERFREKVGMTPMRYITLWRMEKALDLFETTTLSIYEVAGRVGYSSEAALTRAFQRQFGMTPGTARRLSY